MSLLPPLRKTQEASSIKASARLQARLPASQLALLLQALGAYRGAKNTAGGVQIKAGSTTATTGPSPIESASLLAKLRRLGLRFEFADLADVLAQWFPSLGTLGGGAEQPEWAPFAAEEPSSRPKLTWQSVRRAALARLSKAFAKASPAAIDSYTDALNKLQVRAALGCWACSELYILSLACSAAHSSGSWCGAGPGLDPCAVRGGRVACLLPQEPALHPSNRRRAGSLTTYPPFEPPHRK